MLLKKSYHRDDQLIFPGFHVISYFIHDLDIKMNGILQLFLF